MYILLGSYGLIGCYKLASRSKKEALRHFRMLSFWRYVAHFHVAAGLFCQIPCLLSLLHQLFYRKRRESSTLLIFRKCGKALFF